MELLNTSRAKRSRRRPCGRIRWTADASSGSSCDEENNDDIYSASMKHPCEGNNAPKRTGSSRSPYRRLFSVEYALYTLYMLWFVAYGAHLLFDACRENFEVIGMRTRKPLYYLRVFLGSQGYDAAIDGQWRMYTMNFQPMAVLFIMNAVCAAMARRFAAHLRSRAARRSSNNDDSVIRRRLAVLQPLVHVAFGIGFMAYLHGPHVVIPLAFIVVNYFVFTFLQRRVPKWVYVLCLWVGHVSALFLNELYNGYEETYWMQWLLPTSMEASQRITGVGRAPLWHQRMRWHTVFRMCVLRMIAFNYDMWEAHHDSSAARARSQRKHLSNCAECAELRARGVGTQASSNPSTATMAVESNGSRATVAAAAAVPAVVVVCQDDEASSSLSPEPHDEGCRCYRFRTEWPRDLSDYTFLHYMAYIVFTPIYLTGPVTSFNAFVSHLYAPSAVMPRRQMVQYVLRTGCLYACMVLMLHFIYVHAIIANNAVFYSLPLATKAYSMYFYLAFLWLKFSVFWKCARLFALWCGIEVPEDMRRCFSNSFTVRSFWQDWHASFNLWVVRYMYIPMGGRQNVLLSIGPIFFFIAIWHDHKLQLLKWALCIVLSFLLEIVVGSVFGRVEAACMRRGTSSSSNSNSNNRSNDAACELSPSSASSPRRGCLSALVRVAHYWIGKRSRRFLHRWIRSSGGAVSVFALIVANLVGYRMQATTTVQGMESGTDKIIANTLATATPLFFVMLCVTMYVSAAMGLLSRACAEEVERRKIVKV